MKALDNVCVEKISRILGELISGTELTRILSKNNWKDHDTETGIKSISTKWKRINASMLYEINKVKSPKPFFQFVEEVMTPVSFVNSEEGWYYNLKEINLILRFYGYEITDAGKIKIVKATETLSEAIKRSKSLIEKLEAHNIHTKVTEYCTPELLNENYFHAILEASKSVFERIRVLTFSNLDGNQLINEAFKINNPSIIINGNKLENNDEKSQYLGLKSLLNTICYIYRNPTAHSPKLFNEKNENDAIIAFIMMSMAHQQLDHCSCVRFIN
ncbi:TIGR02391 family protein [Psychrobacillus glaciei]|uniref:TIGR02391 family protein n=1 Tax=Psychrobacillus glaciei TaxID=2283160 RepID=A0A5J6SLS7_9BACI|nr:TIGR02391 family protein [Psychrobacillus glaciei]QFF98828.1 TIGR02391 family protein [Psychrobacillus glaciei]